MQFLTLRFDFLVVVFVVVVVDQKTNCLLLFVVVCDLLCVVCFCL